MTTTSAQQLRGAVRIVTRVLESTQGAQLANEVFRHLDPVCAAMQRHEDDERDRRAAEARARRLAGRAHR